MNKATKDRTLTRVVLKRTIFMIANTFAEIEP